MLLQGAERGDDDSSSGWEEADDDEEEGGDEEEGNAAGRGEHGSEQGAEGMPADGEPDQDDADLARRLQEEEDREHYRRLIELTGGGAHVMLCSLSRRCTLFGMQVSHTHWPLCLRHPDVPLRCTSSPRTMP